MILTSKIWFVVVANWLSKDAAIKNPYYGSMMLSCGKVQETIKQ